MCGDPLPNDNPSNEAVNTPEDEQTGWLSTAFYHVPEYRSLAIQEAGGMRRLRPALRRNCVVGNITRGRLRTTSIIQKEVTSWERRVAMGNQDYQIWITTLP
jgi:hypothetical protein